MSGIRYKAYASSFKLRTQAMRSTRMELSAKFGAHLDACQECRMNAVMETRHYCPEGLELRNALVKSIVRNL